MLPCLQEMITESKDLFQPSLSQAVDVTVRALTSDWTWLQSEPSLEQMFCLNLVNACCTRIPISSDAFTSIQSIIFERYFSLITKVGSLYCSYCNTYSTQDQTMLSDVLPDMVERNPSSSVRSYFKWVREFHLILANWQSRLQEKKANYEEISWYFQNQEHIDALADAVAATSLVVSKTEVGTLKDTFLKKFKTLNQLHLKYIPNDPKNRW